MEKIAQKAKDNFENAPVTIAFLGDSVTQGCFEVFMKNEKDIETIFDRKSAYHAYLSDLFAHLYPTVPVNIINAGISGDNAPHGLKRLERDVLRFDPDLVVVCFGLNDCMQGPDKIDNYTNALAGIFDRLLKEGKEVIFMTPNMMNTSLSPHLVPDQQIRKIAARTMEYQLEGIMDQYMDGARSVCARYNIPVCDCYKKWKTLYENGADITELLSNKINHPTREMNHLFAVSLLETMLTK